MPTQLTYTIHTVPNPLTAGATDATVTLLATNETDNPISVEGIPINIPVGAEASEESNTVSVLLLELISASEQGEC
ncbi:MAG: hypothetical protein AAFN81_32370 [Bacteroidota bacterium]